MTYKVVGRCATCSKPITVPTVWFGVEPPELHFGCNCRLQHDFANTVQDSKKAAENFFETFEKITVENKVELQPEPALEHFWKVYKKVEEEDEKGIVDKRVSEELFLLKKRISELEKIVAQLGKSEAVINDIRKILKD